MNWRERALCRYEDPDLFFPIGAHDSGPGLLQTDEAKAVCRRCPVMRNCLDRALAAGPVEGIWGATTEAERRALRRRAARALAVDTMSGEAVATTHGSAA
ncbi:MULTISPECIES: WhiB family transcriptional regulator [Streptomyces]|uniref:Transcriptional regulator WhiB n=1 Tax=Streptomyces liliiviolaceus TaxID=2823109 RepID=A0A940Y055_9ACTN|nr:WhiB family transcriptional regulator [Streptomyces liliiviolaceus]MBQ0850401.1 WhiB family transcriptional regulator [Streptomyces liliiviolaceus]